MPNPVDQPIPFTLTPAGEAVALLHDELVRARAELAASRDVNKLLVAELAEREQCQAVLEEYATPGAFLR